MGKTSLALSNLRAAVIVIVVAFHSSLAYLVSAPAPQAFGQAPYDWKAFPIVDTHHWLGFDIFCAWQDVSLMSLMFLLSGLFVASSLARKGAAKYAGDRLWRIGLPFTLAVIFLSPLAYYPAYLLRAADLTVSGYWSDWLSLPFWPAGPEWFLWQLLALNLLAAAVYALWPRVFADLGRLGKWSGAKPHRFFAILIAASALAYVPLAFHFSPWVWSEFGPLPLQLSRPLHYLVYFTAGLALGANGYDRGLLTCDGPLARHWRAWLAIAAMSFAAWAGLTSLTFPSWEQASAIFRFAASLAFPVACASGGLLWLSGCLRFASKVRLRIVDSLSENAYSIYLVHYVFVVWLQYALLLDSGLFVALKPITVLSGSLIASWAVSVAFRRVMANPAVVPLKGAFARTSH
jgi:hypothetical protein